MDQEKKKELAEMDSRWNFEKTVQAPGNTRIELTWEKVRDAFNQIQTDQGDLYMTIEKKPELNKSQKLKLWWRNKFNRSYSATVTFHHEQVYNWFEKLAWELDKTVGEAVIQFVYDAGDGKDPVKNCQALREQLDLGDTVNVEVNNMGDMAEPKESKVSKDELQEMINDD